MNKTLHITNETHKMLSEYCEAKGLKKNAFVNLLLYAKLTELTTKDIADVTFVQNPEED